MTTNADARRIAIVGVGGAGCNVVAEIHKAGLPVDTIAINTDRSAKDAEADRTMYICKQVLEGDGARGETGLGKMCGDAHKQEIMEALSGYSMVFVVTGLGGGTGTGAAPVVIEAAQSQNILTFAIAIKPFFFEGSRVAVAKDGYNHIRGMCPYTMAIENDLVLTQKPDLTMDGAFHEVNMSIMAHIQECALSYQIEEKDEPDRFESFLKQSPLCAYTSA